MRFIIVQAVGLISNLVIGIAGAESQQNIPFIHLLPFADIYGIYQFGDGLQINFANALRGISDVKPMMVIAFISYFVISLPVGYLCGFVLGWGLVGVWMAFPFGLTSAGLMLWLRFRYKTKHV